MATKHFFINQEVEQSWSEDDRRLAELCCRMIERMASSLLIIEPVETHHVISGLISCWITTMLEFSGKAGLRQSLKAMLRDLPQMHEPLAHAVPTSTQVN
jgi:hypothetical protein